jgi:hypothetical protein
MKSLLSVFLSFSFLVLFAQDRSPNDIFYKFEEKSIDTRSLVSQASARSNGTIFIQLDKWQLELEHSNILSYDYKFVDENGRELTSKESRPIPLNGYTPDGGRVALTIGDGFIYGFIQEGEDLFYIEPARHYKNTSNKDEVIIYNTKDVKPEAPMTCGFDVDQHKSKEFDKQKEEPSSRSAGLCYDVDYAIVNDWSMYDKYGPAGLESRNIAITNNVNVNYKDDFSDEVRFVITGQYNSTCSTCNPFGVTTNLNTTLDNFTAWGVSTLSNTSSSAYIRHDVASFWSDVFNNSGTVGLAWLSVVCNSYRYNVLSDLSTNANTLRVLTAHELGHNFSANHDAANSGFLMAPSVNNTNTWSAASISAISNHVASRTCLQTCSDLPATVFYEGGDLSVLEQGGSGTGGTCQQAYSDYTIPISISKPPNSTVVVGLSTAGSTASPNRDFQLLSPTLTFTSGGNLTQNATVRIYDDGVVEPVEDIDLTFTINSGPANAASANSLNIEIASDDAIESDDGGAGGLFFYGPSYSYLSQDGIFAGNLSDSRSRFLLSADYLTNTLQMGAGEIDMIGFFVVEKTSSGVFNDFRISMKSTTASDLGQVSWGASQVYIGDVTTVQGAFNVMEFPEPYVWDGTSNIYVEVCFNNSSAIGLDKVALFDAGVSNNGQQFSWSTNFINNCSSVTNWTYFYDLQPNVILRQKGATEVETVAAETANSNIGIGETVNLFSDEGRIIASIKNIGSTSLQCVEATVITAGTSRANVPFTSGQYTDKTIQIETGAAGTYELTLYYTEEELQVWQAENYNLNFLRSTATMANATEGNSEFIMTQTVNNTIGAENMVAYTTTVSGSGYFALSDGDLIPVVSANVSGTFENADVIIEEFGKGVLLKNSQGQQYLLSVDSEGNPMLSIDNNSLGSSFLPSGDLCIVSPGKSLMIKRNTSSYARIFINDDGSIVTTNTTSIPSQRITLASGHFGLVDVGSGIIFQNMQNECYKLFVDDNGTLRVGSVGCP